MGQLKNQELEQEFIEDMMRHSQMGLNNVIEEYNQALRDLLNELKKMSETQQNIVQSLSMTLPLIEKHVSEEQRRQGVLSCWCRKCGEDVRCEHSETEVHTKSLCGVCAN